MNCLWGVMAARRTFNPFGRGSIPRGGTTCSCRSMEKDTGLLSRGSGFESQQELQAPVVQRMGTGLRIWIMQVRFLAGI